MNTPVLEAFRQVEGGRVVMNALKEMIRTGQVPLTRSEMLEPVAVAEASRKAHNKARPVFLKDVR